MPLRITQSEKRSKKDYGPSVIKEKALVSRVSNVIFSILFISSEKSKAYLVACPNVLYLLFGFTLGIQEI